MAEKVAIEFSIGDGPAIKSMGDLKRQLKEAQFEALALSEKFGATSQEAIQAAQRVAKLKDAIGDAKDMVDAFNPDAKFKAFSGALQGVAGGFAAVQGAMALFGAESEDVQKTLLKVQSALAISEGLNSVMASIDAFKNLGAVMKSIPIIQKAITVAQRLWNAAMAANPIGLLVVAITALIAAGAALISWFKSSSTEAKKNEAAVNANTQALKKQSDELQRSSVELDRNQKQQLAMAKASGMNAAAIRELEVKLIDEKIAFANSSVEAAKNTLEKQKNTLATLKASDASDELIKAQEDNVKTATALLNTETENYQKAQDEKTDILNRHKVEIQQVETDAENERKKKAAEDYEKRKDKEKQEREERLQAEKKFQEDLKNLRDENYLNSIKDDDTRAKEKALLDFQNSLAEIQARKISDEAKQQLIKENAIKYQAELAAIDDEAKKRNQEITDKEIEDEIARLQADVDYRLQKKKEAKEAELKIEAEKNKALEELQNTYFGVASAGIGILKQFGEKNKTIQRAALIGENALTIARIILDTQKANAAVTAKYALIPGGQAIAAAEILTNKIKAGIGIATAIAATAKGLQGIGGAGGSASSSSGQNLGASGGGGAAAPVPAQLSGTALNQQMINSMNNATNRSFVLESDISGNQERIQRLNRAARIS